MQTSPRKSRLNAILSLLFVLLIAATFLYFIVDLRHLQPQLFYILLAICAFISFNIYQVLTAKYRRRNEVLKQAFPPHWRIILNEYVAFYRGLDATGKERFERNVQIFLEEKRITGIKTEIDDTVKLLVASSALIPIFGFPEWEYDNLGEVLIYPSSFDHTFRQEGKGRFIQGMVGSGPMNKIMILSKSALIQGFVNPKDGRNVGIHEFVHLIDSEDGDFDGLTSLLDKKYALPWIDMIHTEIAKIKAGDTRINAYGATSKVEFFAVVSEYFFENPQELKTEHPAVFKMLTHIFHQDPIEQLKYAVQDMAGYRGEKLGRNSPCPCGSGKKYKQCCLKKL